jgi:hypothetical protein
MSRRRAAVSRPVPVSGGMTDDQPGMVWLGGNTIARAHPSVSESCRSGGRAFCIESRLQGASYRLRSVVTVGCGPWSRSVPTHG